MDETPGRRYPPFAKPMILVYRECPCGNWLATDEAAHAPACHQCGGYYVPGGGPQDNNINGSQWEARRDRGLGFAAILLREHQAADLVSTVNLFSHHHRLPANRVRGLDGGYYTEDERRLASDEILARAEAEQTRSLTQPE